LSPNAFRGGKSSKTGKGAVQKEKGRMTREVESEPKASKNIRRICRWKNGGSQSEVKAGRTPDYEREEGEKI